MRKLFVATLFAFLSVMSVSASRAVDVGTPAEAKAMAEKAAEFLKANGPEKAFVAFETAGGAFHDKDLYVFVYDPTGKCVSIGASPALKGKNLIDLKDVDGKPFIRELVNVSGAGWIEYKWRNPATKAVSMKTSYVIRTGDYLVGVGAYKS